MEASYLRLFRTGELYDRANQLEAMLESCNICPRDCFINRLEDQIAKCFSGRLPVVSTYTPHFGEEPVLIGTRGAGNIFLGNCNLRCVYCQNFQISQNPKVERKNEVTHEEMAAMMLKLQAHGCHNINFVSPTHFVPQIVRALVIAVEQGLHLPIVYNTNAYDSVEVLRLLDGIVDVYLPDLKYSDEEMGQEFSKVESYVKHARAAIAEMHRQVGTDLQFGEDNLLKRGLIIRLLVLPNNIGGICESLQWIHDTLSPHVALSVMAQYYPTNKVPRDDSIGERYMLLNRRVGFGEYARVLDTMERLGMREGWQQEIESASNYYRPDFSNPELPFEDIRDFVKASQ
ncbi:MAG TPA: radical SAM protein [Acidobacteriota bacterium]|nr:radical SAM protein [Acidobacteriota bacterium]